MFSFLQEVHFPCLFSYLFLVLCILDSNHILVKCWLCITNIFSYFASFCFIYSFLWGTEAFLFFFPFKSTLFLRTVMGSQQSYRAESTESSHVPPLPCKHNPHYTHPHQGGRLLQLFIYMDTPLSSSHFNVVGLIHLFLTFVLSRNSFYPKVTEIHSYTPFLTVYILRVTLLMDLELIFWDCCVISF